jgi:hypothetical protein
MKTFSEVTSSLGFGTVFQASFKVGGNKLQKDIGLNLNKLINCKLPVCGLLKQCSTSLEHDTSMINEPPSTKDALNPEIGAEEFFLQHSQIIAGNHLRERLWSVIFPQHFLGRFAPRCDLIDEVPVKAREINMPKDARGRVSF